MKVTPPDWVLREFATYFERQSSLSKLVEVCITGIQALADNPKPLDPGVDPKHVEVISNIDLASLEHDPQIIMAH